MVGIGLIGVWRTTQLDYVSDDDSVYEDMAQEDQFQPETHDFYITEISQGIILINCMCRSLFNCFQGQLNTLLVIWLQSQSVKSSS